MAEITPAGPGYDDPVRAEGTAKLKMRMGGDVPLLKQRASPRGAELGKINSMYDARDVDLAVPRRPATENEPGTQQ